MSLRLVCPTAYFAVLILGFAVMPGASLSADAAEPPMRVGIYQNNPKLFIDKDGTPDGFFPDLIDHLAQNLDRPIQYVPCDWARCLEMLESGDLDIMPDVAFTEARAARFTFGHEAVLHSWSHVYSKDAQFLEDVSDLDGRRVAVVRGSLQLQRLRAAAKTGGWQPEIIETDSFLESFRAVADGRADYTICNRFFGHRNARQFGFRNSQLVLWPAPVYLAFSNRVDPALIRGLDTAVSLLKADAGSIFYEASDRWFAQGHGWAVSTVSLYWGAAALTLLVLVSVAANAYMRRRVEAAVAALAASEARFREYAESGSDFFWEMDKDLRFSYFSAQFEPVTGLPPVRLLGRTREETGIPNVEPEAWARHLDDIRNRRPFRDFVHPRTKPDGSVVYLSIAGRPDFDENGIFRGYRGTGTDITAQKFAELSRNAALQEAEVANRAKSEFLATMSHEFRTPLNAIIGFSDMIRNLPEGRFTAERILDYADAIHQSGQHMLTLVNDILDISTIEAGKLQLHKTVLDFDSVLTVCLTEAGGAAQGKRITLSSDLEDGLPPLFADEKSVRQILTNLLSNAIKFTEAGGCVTVSARRSRRGLTISVEDTGIGIPSDKLASITDPFIQATTDPHTSQEGTGLGLSIVKSLVEVHGGTLRVENRRGGGTSVTFDLPLARDPHQRLAS